MNETVSIMTVSSTDNVQQPKKEAAKKLTNDTRTELNYRTAKLSSKASSNLCELLASGTTIRLSVYSALLLLSRLSPLSLLVLLSAPYCTYPRPYIGQFTIGLPRPIRRQQGTGAQSINQSACKEELARKCRPIRELTGTGAKVAQSECLQEPRECRRIRAQRGTRAQSISQSEGCQERARTPTNQSACRNRANADQSERREEPARKVSANPRAARNARERQPIRALAGTPAKVSQSERLQEPRECRPIRALAGTCCARTRALTK